MFGGAGTDAVRQEVDTVTGEKHAGHPTKNATLGDRNGKAYVTEGKIRTLRENDETPPPLLPAASTRRERAEEACRDEASRMVT